MKFYITNYKTQSLYQFIPNYGETETGQRQEHRLQCRNFVLYI